MFRKVKRWVLLKHSEYNLPSAPVDNQKGENEGDLAKGLAKGLIWGEGMGSCLLISFQSRPLAKLVAE